MEFQNYRIQNMVYVGNPALTALLNSKKGSGKHSINFDFAIKCNIANIKILSWIYAA